MRRSNALTTKIPLTLIIMLLLLILGTSVLADVIVLYNAP